MLPVSLVFFFSGLAALIYELLWLRHLGLIFGNTVQAAATVLTAYMLGLATGAHIAGRSAHRLRRPLLAFGVLEAGIGLYAVLIPLMFLAARLIYRLLYQHVSDEPVFLTVVRFVLGLLILIVPTSLMGATLPVLARGFLRSHSGFGKRFGLLYGMNTLGAATGLMLCGFVLIPSFGIAITNYIAVGINATVGVTAIVLSSLIKLDADSGPLGSDSLESGPQTRSFRIQLLLIGAAISGFIALALEVVWFRALILVFGSTTYSFSAMLTVFLLGIALGSALLGWITDHVKQPVAVFVLAQLAIGLYTLVSMRWFNAMPDTLIAQLMHFDFSWTGMLTAKFSITLIFLLPVTMLLGVAFTAIVKAVREIRESSSRVVGDVYTVNTIGAALGSTIGGFCLLPILGIERTLMALAYASLIVGICFCLVGRVSTGVRATALAMSVFGAAIGVFFPPQWDKQLLSAGPFFAPWNYVQEGEIILRHNLASERLLYYKEGKTASVSVIQGADEDLFFSSNGKVEADTTARSMVLQRMMGHLPMLFHPTAERVVNIGLGAGVTFGALGCYPVEHLQVVEIEPAVKEVVKIWGERNHHILDHPKAVVTINDGRNHLFATAERYDVITSDPFEPVMAGAANLYTVEHFQQARRRLYDDGIMCQYLPLYELSGEDYASILRSFVSVFPRSVLFFAGFDTIILGLNRDAELRIESVIRQFEIPAVRESLSELGFTAPEMILGMYAIDLEQNRDFIRSGRLNTDSHPFVEFSAPKSTLHYTPDKNQEVLLEQFTDIPLELLSGLAADQRVGVLRSHEALRKTLVANGLRQRGSLQENVALLLEAAAEAPDNPVIRNELAAALWASAQVAQRANMMDHAEIQFTLSLKYDPRGFWPLHHLVVLSMRAGQVDRAREYLERGLAQFPTSPLFIALRGKFRGTLGDLEGACEDLRSAIAALPRRAVLWEDYSLFLERSGKHAESENARKEAKRLMGNVR
jgi:spermidine synthase